MESTMGRKPIGKVAMTGSERVRRYRLKHAADRPVTKSASPVTKQASPDHAALVKEVAQLRAELAQAKAGAADRMTKPEPKINPATFSMTAQQRNEAWKRQQTKEMAQGFHQAVNARVKEFLEETILPLHRKEQEQAKQVMNARKGIMTKDTFRQIWGCLHTERLAQLLNVRHDQLDGKLAKRYEAAFNQFSALEKLLLTEKDSPTEFQNLSLADLEKMKAAATAKRKAKRAASHSAVGRR
jgi:hypothetical protein